MWGSAGRLAVAAPAASAHSDSEKSSGPQGLAGQLPAALSSPLQGSILNRPGPGGVYREEMDRPP